MSCTNPPDSNRPNRHFHVDRSVRTCESCRRHKQPCSGMRPCTRCTENHTDCVYSVVSDLPRTVFTTTNARRLSSGSACETCRRRKTKCDGGSPCSYCAGAGIECVNHSERRKRAAAAAAAAAATAAAAGGTHPSLQSPSDHEAMDRIEDRLRRIEKLMTAFTPSSNSPLAITRTTPTTAARRHRHSVQGICAIKEQAELRAAYALKKKRPSGLSPPPSPLYGDTSTTATSASSAAAAGSTPMIRQNSAQSTQPLTASMLNLTLSPSSSTTSSAPSPMMLAASMSTPSSAEWEFSLSSIPSLMDQLSKRTFGNTPAFTFPPYPLTPPSRPPPPSIE